MRSGTRVRQRRHENSDRPSPVQIPWLSPYAWLILHGPDLRALLLPESSLSSHRQHDQKSSHVARVLLSGIHRQASAGSQSLMHPSCVPPPYHRGSDRTEFPELRLPVSERRSRSPPPAEPRGR